MLKSLVIKELRESLWLVIIALLLYAWLLRVLMKADQEGMYGYAIPSPAMALRVFPTRSSEVPFAGGSFSSSFVTISVLFALGLGFQQSLKESRQGTYLFLLHRPSSRKAIFLTKMAVGVGLVLACGVLPILIYACWASLPGNVPAPFQWSMTADAWWHWVSMPLVYLGAYLSGLRPAAWYGTRLAPLAFACSATFMLEVILSQVGLSVIVVALTYACLYAAMVYCALYVAASRDYS